jgi:hypothetical protein
MIIIIVLLIKKPGRRLDHLGIPKKIAVFFLENRIRSSPLSFIIMSVKKKEKDKESLSVQSDRGKAIA